MNWIIPIGAGVGAWLLLRGAKVEPVKHAMDAGKDPAAPSTKVVDSTSPAIIAQPIDVIGATGKTPCSGCGGAAVGGGPKVVDNSGSAPPAKSGSTGGSSLAPPPPMTKQVMEPVPVQSYPAKPAVAGTTGGPAPQAVGDALKKQVSAFVVY